MQHAVFLDRDNTLIENDGDLGDPRQVHLVEGVAPALARLREAGYRLVVVTNQGGVARSKLTEADVDAVNQRTARLVCEATGRHDVIDRFYYCPYHPEGTLEQYRRDHPWRKPNPGMIVQAGRDLTLDLARSWLIGDQERDIAAGRAAGCRTVLVSQDQKLVMQAKASATVETITQAVDFILAKGVEDPPPGDNAPAAPSPLAAPPPGPAPGPGADLRRAVLDLTDEIRSDRQRRGELTAFRMAACVAQLLVVLMAMMGLLQVDRLEDFLKWMAGAIILQLLTITLLLVDQRS